VALTQSTSYAMFPGLSSTEIARRKAYLLEVASAASKQILGARGEPTALLRAAGQAAGERRILVWSADPAVQADLAQTSVAGIIPITAEPYAGLSIVNGGGNKLDYYLDRSLTWTRTGCGVTRATTVTIKLTNNAPASGLSPYVTGRSDTHSYPVRPGDTRLAVSYFATQGATMQSITVNGRPGTGRIGTERGHPVYAVDVEIPRGTSRTVVLQLTEPAGSSSAPIVLRQPLVRPLTVTLTQAPCASRKGAQRGGRLPSGERRISMRTGRGLRSGKQTIRSIRPASTTARANARDHRYRESMSSSWCWVRRPGVGVSRVGP